MGRGRKKTSPESTEEWQLRAAKVKYLREARGYYVIADLLGSEFWAPLKKVPGLSDASYYKYERAVLCFQNNQLHQIAKVFQVSPDLLINSGVDFDKFVENVKQVTNTFSPTSTGTHSAAPRWILSVVSGSTCSIQSGIVSTSAQKNGCHDGWFRGTTTAILGSDDQERYEKTQACWQIDTNCDSLKKFQRGYVVIGCIRRFGGLHSSRFGAQVDIILNGRPIDNFSLMIIPDGHTDYFHRVPPPNLPDIKPISACETLYTWSIQKSDLNEKNHQIVTVVIEREISWDIDYVGLLWEDN